INNNSATTSLTITTTTGTPAGSSGFTVNNNKDSTTGSGTLIVSAALSNQTITFGTLADKTYGDANFTVSATGGASGNPVTFTASGNCSVSGTTVHITGAGSCTVTAHQAGNGSYNAAPDVPRSFNIAKATPDCSSIAGYSGTYDGSAHGASGTCQGVGSDGTLSGLDLGGSFTDVPGGTADWTFSGDSNYNSANGTVAIAITSETIDVTANATGKIYGAGDPALTYGWDGTPAPAAGDFSGTLTRDAGEDIGPYAISQGTLSLPSDYTLHFIGSTFTISEKQFLTVTPDSQTITYGDPDPTFTFEYSGFVNGDATSSVSGAPTCSVSDPHSDAGTYDITCSDGNDPNYDFSYNSAELVVNPADADCSVTGYNTPYDGTAHTATGSCTGVLGGDLSSGLDLSATTHTDPGSYADTWSFTDPTSGNYNNQLDIALDDEITAVDATTTVTTSSGGGGGGGPAPTANNAGTNTNSGGNTGTTAPPSNGGTATTPPPTNPGQVLGASVYNFTKNLRHYEIDPDVAALQ
ncbi:MAG: MBG domain-containing protein, partial [Minisyncoccia bacterium]